MPEIACHSPRSTTRRAQERLATIPRRKSTSKGGRSSAASFMKVSQITKDAVAPSMAATPLSSEVLLISRGSKVVEDSETRPREASDRHAGRPELRCGLRFLPERGPVREHTRPTSSRFAEVYAIDEKYLCEAPVSIGRQ